MGQNTGTVVVAPVRPYFEEQEFPVVEDQYLGGGYRSVATLSARDAIPAPRRKHGMLVFVRSEGLIYELSEDLTTWGLFEPSGAGGIAAHEAALDPHPQYLTQPEADQRYAASGEALTPQQQADLDANTAARHNRNEDDGLAEGTANHVTAEEIRAFIDAGGTLDRLPAENVDFDPAGTSLDPASVDLDKVTRELAARRITFVSEFQTVTEDAQVDFVLNTPFDYVYSVLLAGAEARVQFQSQPAVTISTGLARQGMTIEFKIARAE